MQLPLPKNIDQNVIINKLYPLKDVDGLTPFNSGMLMKGKPAITLYPHGNFRITGFL